MNLVNTVRYITDHPLTRHQKLKALGRWLRWQVGSRIVPGQVAVGFVNDSVLLVSPGMTGATGNIYVGLHEYQEMSFLLHLLRPGDTFVDAGANVGTYTVLASKVAQAECISIEPVRKTFDHLMRNVNLNGVCELVDARNVGLGSRKGRLKFSSGLDTVNHVLDASEVELEGEEVEVDTLDDIVAGRSPCLIKIDVEGYEREVVAGARALLARPSLLGLIVETNGSGSRYGFDQRGLHEEVIGYGFIPCSYEPASRSLRRLADGERLGGNTLYIRDPEEAAELVRSAPPFRVNAVTAQV